MFKFILALLLVSSSAWADEWSREDTYREATYLTLHTMDWAQTRNIARNPNYHEQNAILGKHPSVGRVDGYFALTGLAHFAVAYYLPTEYRKAFQYVTIGIEGGAVVHNFSLGIGVRF
ncbi:MAG: hypothetical protein WAW75_08745 [Gallionella sp.]